MPNLFNPGDHVRLNSTGGTYYIIARNGYGTLELGVRPNSYVWLTQVDPKQVTKL